MGGNEHAMILAGKVDPDSRKIELAGVSSAGTLIFKTDGENCTLGPGIPDQARHIFRRIPRDMANIFLFNMNDALAENSGDGYITLIAQDGTESLFHPQQDGSLQLKERYHIWHWHCAYSSGGKTAVSGIPFRK